MHARARARDAYREHVHVSPAWNRSWQRRTCTLREPGARIAELIEQRAKWVDLTERIGRNSSSNVVRFRVSGTCDVSSTGFSSPVAVHE